MKTDAIKWFFGGKMNLHHRGTTGDERHNDDIRIIVGKRLRQCRTDKKLTMVMLGRIAQCSQSFLSKVENGSIVPSIPMLHRLAHALDVKPSSLLVEIVRSAGDQAAGRPVATEQDP